MESKTDMIKREIDKCLTEIAMWYPELLLYQDENPMSSSSETGNITEADLKNYLELLRSQMATYCRMHNKSTNA